MVGGKINLIATLFEGDAKHLLALERSGAIGGIDLQDVVSTFALFAEDGEGFGGEIRGNDAVAHLALDEQGGGFIARVGEGNKVTVARHAVGTTGTGIGRGDGRKGQGEVVAEIDAAQSVAHGQPHGSTGGRDVLKGSRCGQTGGRFELAHKLPAVESIEEVDVTGTSGEHLDGEGAAVVHVDAGRRLVGVATILQSQFVHKKRKI